MTPTVLRSQAVTRQDPQPAVPSAQAKSGFEWIWKGLDIDSATIELQPSGTVAAVWSPRLAVESRRMRLAQRIEAAHACIGNAAWRGLKAAAGPVARAVPAAVHAVTGRG